MSKDNAPKDPTHHAFSVREGEDGKSYFNRIGASWEHKDGEGHNIVLTSLPVDGRVTLRTPKERAEDMKGNKRSNNRRDDRRDRYDEPGYER